MANTLPIWKSLGERLKNMPSIKLWGIVIWVFGILLFCLLIINVMQAHDAALLAQKLSVDNESRFTEIVANQTHILNAETAIDSDNKTQIGQNIEILQLLHQGIEQQARNSIIINRIAPLLEEHIKGQDHK